MQYPIQ